MKNATFHFLAAAVVLGVSAGAASAQNLKANINFPFRVGVSVMSPGSYIIARIGTQAVYRIASENKSLLFVGTSPSTAHAESHPKLVFECGADSCVLAQVWTGSVKYQVPHQLLPRDHETHTVAVLLTHAADGR
jgi:hypothetical protein